MLLTVLAAAAVLASPDTGRKVTFTGDAGLVNVNGNSDVTTLSVGNKLGIKLGAWSIGQTFGLAYAKSNDSVTASWVHGSLRGDRSLSPHVGVYLLTEFDRNRFAGVDSRIGPSAGVAAVLVADSSNLLRAELGAGYTWQNAVAPDPSRAFAAGRAALSFRHRLHGKSAFAEEIEVLPDLNNGADIRINSESAVTAPIATGIAMKASYVIHYAGLPEPGFKKVDRILTTGVQITL